MSRISAVEAVEADELETVKVLLFNIGCCSIRPPPNITVLEFVVDMGRVSGFRLTRKQPVPGTKIVWKETKKQMKSMQVIKGYRVIQQDWADGIGLCILSSVE